MDTNGFSYRASLRPNSTTGRYQMSKKTEKISFNDCLLKAQQGDRNEQFRLSLFYFNGNGVTRNYEEGLKWCHAAAAQGHLDAQLIKHLNL
jgi:TPR repeat protein